MEPKQKSPKLQSDPEVRRRSARFPVLIPVQVHLFSQEQAHVRAAAIRRSKDGTAKPSAPEI